MICIKINYNLYCFVISCFFFGTLYAVYYPVFKVWAHLKRIILIINPSYIIVFSLRISSKKSHKIILNQLIILLVKRLFINKQSKCISQTFLICCWWMLSKFQFIIFICICFLLFSLENIFVTAVLPAFRYRSRYIINVYRYICTHVCLSSFF